MLSLTLMSRDEYRPGTLFLHTFFNSCLVIQFLSLRCFPTQKSILNPICNVAPCCSCQPRHCFICVMLPVRSILLPVCYLTSILNTQSCLKNLFLSQKCTLVLYLFAGCFILMLFPVRNNLILSVLHLFFQSQLSSLSA